MFKKNRRGNQEWTIQKYWQNWVHKTQDDDIQSKKHNTENLILKLIICQKKLFLLNSNSSFYISFPKLWVSACCLMPHEQFSDISWRETSYVRWDNVSLCLTNTLIVFIVLHVSHWNNSPLVDMVLNSTTMSWFRANQSLFFLLSVACKAEKQQIPILSLVCMCIVYTTTYMEWWNGGGVKIMVFNATFNNIPVIQWRSVLLAENTADLSQVTDKLYYIMFYAAHFAWAESALKMLVVMGTECTHSCISNYHTITTMTGPRNDEITFGSLSNKKVTTRMGSIWLLAPGQLDQNG